MSDYKFNHVQDLKSNSNSISFRMGINPLAQAKAEQPTSRIVFNDPDAWSLGKTHKLYLERPDIGNHDILFNGDEPLGTFTIREVLKDGTMVCDFMLPVHKEHLYDKINSGKAFKMHLLVEETTSLAILSGVLLTLEV